MSKAAKLSVLEQLHAKVAQRMLTELDSDELSPQMLSQAVKFLKDNGIEPASDADNKALDALAARVDAVLNGDDTDAIRDILN